VLAAGETVEGIDVPLADQVVNRYPVAVLSSAPNADAAQQFVAYLSSHEGREVFERAGFVTP
jgi:molybdate transport system substrate-binding protein